MQFVSVFLICNRFILGKTIHHQLKNLFECPVELASIGTKMYTLLQLDAKNIDTDITV